MEHTHKVLSRYGKPHSMDKLPYGTECNVWKDNNKHDVYVQLNHDENEPHWTLIQEDVNDDSCTQDL